MTKTWSDMASTVRPYAPDCPEIAVAEALKSTAIDFFEKTHTWLHNCTPMPAEKGRSDYQLDIPKGAVLARVHQAWYEGVALDPIGEDQAQSVTQRHWPSTTGWPRQFTQQEPCTFLLLPAPTEVIPSVSMIEVVAALRPSRDGNGLPSELWDRYADSIAYGTRARIHEIPNQSYTDEKQATKFRQMFYGRVGAARADRNRGLTRAVIVVRPNRFE